MSATIPPAGAAAAPPLRVGLIVDSDGAPYWARRLIDGAGAAYAVTALIRRDRPARGAAGVMDRVRRLALRAIEAAERLAFCRDAPLADTFALQNTAARVSRIAPQSEIGALGGLDALVAWEPGPCDQALAEAADADLVAVRFGPGGEAGEAMTAVAARRPCSAFEILHRRRGEAEARLLAAGAIPTRRFYAVNKARIAAKAAAHLGQALGAVAAGAPALQPRRIDGDKAPAAAPKLRDQARYLIKASTHAAGKAARALRGGHRWAVAYQHAPDWRAADLSQCAVIDNPPGRFFADPFVWRGEDAHYLFVEDYHDRDRRGRISAIRVRADGCDILGPVLEEPFHLSFPFLFEADGALYMCPETHQAREIRLYRCEGFPDRWRHVRTLMRDVDAVDTMIFPYADRWRMLTNIDASALGDHGSELYLFDAPRFDAEDWRAHPSNPVVFDAARARNGGLILGAGGAVHRVFQRHGFDRYGAAMGVAEIKHISQTNYSEEIVREIAPDFLPRLGGAHSLSWRDGLLAIDIAQRR